MTSKPNSQGVRPDCTDDHENKHHPVTDIIPVPDACVWLSKEAHAKYAEVSKAFEVAENDLKRAEVIDNKHRPLVPAINELRYCSHHLVNAISETCADNQIEELRRAKRHCERASYDSLSIALSFLIMHIDRFKDQFIPKNVVMTDIIKSYADDMATVLDSQDLLTVDYKNKVEKYVEVRRHVDKLTKIRKTLVCAESSIKAAANKESRAYRFALIGLITASLIAGAAWYKNLTGENKFKGLTNQVKQLQLELKTIKGQQVKDRTTTAPPNRNTTD